MIHSVKDVVRRALDAGGAFAVARRLTTAWPRILTYHQFTGPGETNIRGTAYGNLRQHLEHITRHYRPLRLRELSDILAASEQPPPRLVVITVDDGHASFLRWALPLLEEFQVPATLFVVSDLLESGIWLWTDKWEYLCIQTRASRVLGSASGRRATIDALKRMPAAERDRQLDELARRAGIRLPAVPPPPYLLLSAEDLRVLSRSRLIEIGSHSRTHATLATLDIAQSREEVSGSRHALERLLGIPITAFCYPNGLPGDYSAAHLAMVADAGYQCATAGHFGYVTAESNRFALPRVSGDEIDRSGFHMVCDGFEYLRRRSRGERCW